jgi:osmotically-inducible protein OsmY
MSDLSLHSAIMQALADNPYVHPDEISAQVDGGDVVLRGTVGSPVQKAEAMSAARAVPGVHDVVDALQVRLLGIDGKLNADTEAVVLDALLGDGELSLEGLVVESRGGALTLRGSVDLASQRDRAERIALAVPGVARVENRLCVRRTASADDVAERVTAALLAGDQIAVELDDNEVTLSGTVSSPAQRDAAIAAAARAPGVVAVRDKLVMHPHAS